MAEREPASIRFNNPGAMWGGNALARKWGATANIPLNDGKGQGNTIAFFPTKVAGAAAQFDLWRTSGHYRNKKLSDAIKTWSGGNSWGSYVNFLTSRVPGLTGNTVINEAFLSSPSGVAMMKAQAWHEAGKPYPMTDAEWLQAQAKVFGKVTAAQNVVPPKADYSNDVRRVQAALNALGYHEVGTVDGLMGGRTRGAIAAFMNDRHEVATTSINPALTAELDKAKAEGWTRPIAPGRAYATADDLAPKVPAVAATQRAGLWSKVMGWLGIGGAAAQGIATVIPAANDQVSPYWSMAQGWFKWLVDVPGWVPMLIVGVVAFVIWNESRKSKNAQVADYQTGRLN